MANSHSFKEHVADVFDSQFWEVAESFLRDDFDSLGLEFYKLRRPGEPEINEVKVEHVWADSLSDVRIQFDVALSVNITVPDADYHYDEYEEKTFWLMVRCKGSLDLQLKDFEIFDVDQYNGKNRAKDPLDDSLVPYIGHESLEKTATDFLKAYYPEALCQSAYGGMLSCL